MCKECTPYVPVYRLLVHSGFGDYFGNVEYSAIENIQDIISMSSVLMLNDAAVCGGRMGLKILVRD